MNHSRDLPDKNTNLKEKAGLLSLTSLWDRRYEDNFEQCGADVYFPQNGINIAKKLI